MQRAAQRRLKADTESPHPSGQPADPRMTRRASASSVSCPLTRSRSETNSSSKYESVSSGLGPACMRRLRVWRLFPPRVAGCARRQRPGAGFARGQRGAQARVAAAEHCDVVDVLLVVNRTARSAGMAWRGGIHRASMRGAASTATHNQESGADRSRDEDERSPSLIATARRNCCSDIGPRIRPTHGRRHRHIIRAHRTPGDTDHIQHGQIEHRSVEAVRRRATPARG